MAPYLSSKLCYIYLEKGFCADVSVGPDQTRVMPTPLERNERRVIEIEPKDDVTPLVSRSLLDDLHLQIDPVEGRGALDQLTDDVLSEPGPTGLVVEKTPMLVLCRHVERWTRHPRVAEPHRLVEVVDTVEEVAVVPINVKDVVCIFILYKKRVFKIFFIF